MKAKVYTKGITNPQTRHQRIANSLGRVPIPSDHILFEIHIEEQSYNSSKYHKTSACYGFRNVIGHGHSKRQLIITRP